MSATKEHNHDQIEAGQRGKQHPISWLNMPGYKPQTWNPIVGCLKVSPGCDNCYAERMANRLAHNPKTKWKYEITVDFETGRWSGNTHFLDDELTKPMRWKEPRMVFVCSMGDLFYDEVSFEWIDSVFSVMSDNDQHIYVLLTKRPERILEFFCWKILKSGCNWRPKDNIWFGVTAENQEQANIRIPLLLKVPCAIRLVSIEPMLGRINIAESCKTSVIAKNFDYSGVQKLHWVICGGESGSKARPMHPDWVRSLRDQCKAANTSFFFKQWGEWQSYWFNMTSKEVCFKMYSSYLQFTQKDWVNKGDACISLDGKLCKTGGDMQQAQYPVAIMQRLGRKNTGNMIDGERHQNWPKINL